MRRTFLFGLFALLCMCAANHACAQHRGGGGMSATGAGGHGSRAAMPATVGRGHGFNRGRGGSAHRFHHGYHGYGMGYGMGYGYLPGDFDSSDMSYDSGDEYTDESQPYDAQQPPAPAQPASRPVVEPKVHPVITEYTWPASPSASVTHSEAGAETSSELGPEDFEIVLKNGSTVSAAVVFASNHWLHYVDPDERHLRISMSEVDRAATLKLNRERNLNLYLPAAE